VSRSLLASTKKRERDDSVHQAHMVFHHLTSLSKAIVNRLEYERTVMFVIDAATFTR
jgi:hypothetical protein